jgi:iron complex outermembrane receptor protein
MAQKSVDEKDSGVLEEIIVTSRRYKENIADVPLSVNVLSAEDIEDLGFNNVRDIVDYSPGGVSNAFNKMQDEYSLRGISSQTEGPSGDSSVVTVIDEVPVTREFMKSQNFFDLETVEVLRGPQGISFGRNATSGLMHFKTARPKSEFGANFTGEVGSDEQYRAEGYVTGALGENVAGRLAVSYVSLDGFTTDTRTGEGLGAEENVSVRGSLLFDVNDDVEVYLKAQYSEDNDDNPSPRKGKDCTKPYQGGDPPGPSVAGGPQPVWSKFPTFIDSCDPWETTISTPTYLGDFHLKREITTLTAIVNWGFGDGLALSSVTGYLDGNSDYLIDAHGGPNNAMFQNTLNDGHQFSQEFRLDNQGADTKLHWLAGVYYLDDKQDRFDQNIFYVDDAARDPQAESGFRPETRDIKDQSNKTETVGIFSEFKFALTEQVEMSVGGRYSKDDKDYAVAHYGWGWGGPLAGLTNGIDADGDGVLDEQCKFAPSGPPSFGLRFCGSPENPVGFENQVPVSNDWDNFSFKASLSYFMDSGNTIYGLFSQGYKTGGFQSEPFNPADAAVPYNEETVDNYEIGFKGTIGERFRLYASAFYSKYEDLQMFLFVNSVTGDFNQVTRNAGDVDIKGLEVDYTWQITDNFRLSGTAAWIDSELKNTMIDTDGDGVTEEFDGTRPDNTPEWTGSAIAEYTWRMSSGAALILRGDWRGLSDVFDDIGENPDRRHDSYNLLGARLTWYPASANWSLSAWGRNLTDKAYTTQVGPAQPNIAQLNFMYGAPLSYGVTFSYTL